MQTGVCVRSVLAFFGLPQGMPEPPLSSDCTIVVVFGGLEFIRCEAPSKILVLTELRELFFSTGEADLIAHRGVRALRARGFSLRQGLCEPQRTTDCTIVVVSG